MNLKMEHKIETFCCDLRKVVNVSRPPVGSGATRGARPLPRLGCFACKHLTWIFRSLVSPASAMRSRLQSPAEAELRAEHNHFFVLSPAERPVWPGSACPRLASAGSSLSVSFSSQWKFHPKRWLRAGPEPSLRIRIRTGDSVATDPSSWHHCEPLTYNLPASVTHPRYGQIIKLYSDMQTADWHPSGSQGRARNEREKNDHVLSHYQCPS